MVKDTGLPIKIDKILAKMQERMAEEASTLRGRVTSGKLPASDAANAAEKAYDDLRSEATQQIIEYIDSRK